MGEKTEIQTRAMRLNVSHSLPFPIIPYHFPRQGPLVVVRV